MESNNELEPIRTFNGKIHTFDSKIHAAKFIHISWCGERLINVKFSNNWLDVTCSTCFESAPSFSALKDKKKRKMIRKLLKEQTK